MFPMLILSKISLLLSLHFFAVVSGFLTDNTVGHTDNPTALLALATSNQDTATASAKASSSRRIVNTVEDMKAANVSAGATVITKGFYNAHDYGGARYTVSKSPLYPTETNLSIPLSNGLYANLSFGKKSIINVEVLGIKDGFIAGALNAVMPHLSGKIDGIKFPNGNYYVEDAVVLTSVHLYGTDNSTIIVDKNYASNCFAVFRTDTDISNSISFYNLHMVANIDNNVARKDTITLLYLRNIKGCKIYDCTFQANESADINPFVAVNLVWFQTDYASNVTVKNSNFVNNTGLYYQTGSDIKLHGGCLWFSGETLDARQSNLTISNCVFDSTVADEHVGIWNGHFSDVNLSHCSFSSNSKHISDNFLTFCSASYDSVTISDIDMAINSSTMYPMKFTNFLESSNFDISNCNLTFNFEKKSDPAEHAFSVLYIDEDWLAGTDIPVEITFRNSTFVSASDNVIYGSLIQCHNTTQKTLRFIDCTTNIQCVREVISMSGNNNISIENSPSFQ